MTPKAKCFEQTHSAGVVDDGEVGLSTTGLRRLGLDEVVGLAQVVVLQLFFKGLVSSFGEHRLFLQDGQDTHGLVTEQTNVIICVSATRRQSTFSINSMQACKSIPKSIKVHSIPSFLYSSCSSTNMWWLKNCCNFSLVKLMQSCSNPLNCGATSGTR